MADTYFADTYFRVTVVTFDNDENVSTVTAVASGDCLEVVRALSPDAKITASDPAKVTMLLADVLELLRAAGSACDDDPRFAGGRLIYKSLRKIVDGLAS